MPISRCHIVEKISDLEDKSTEITRTKAQRKMVEKSKRASKRYRIMSDGLINLMTKSKPQIQEAQKTSNKIFKLLKTIQ